MDNVDKVGTVQSPILVESVSPSDEMYIKGDPYHCYGGVKKMPGNI